MPPAAATVLCFLFILASVSLQRAHEERTSAALWIPLLWLLIIASRPVSAWLEALGLYSSGLDISSPDANLDGSPLDRLVFTVLIVAAVLVLTHRRVHTLRLLRHNLPLVLFVMYCGISTLWSDYTLVGFKRWIKCVGDVAMACVVVTDEHRSSAVRALYVRAGFVLIPLSVLLIKFYPDLGRTYHVWTWTYMFTGVTQGKNMLGATCLILGLASLSCFLDTWQCKRVPDSRYRLVVHAIILIMVGWLFSLANSMTSLTCFILVGAVLGCVTLTKSVCRPRLLHLLNLVVIVIPFSVLFLGVDTGSLTSMNRDPSLTGRTDIWQMVIQMTDNPLGGAGFESFWTGDRLRTIWRLNDGWFRGIQSAHNGYLEVFANLGWLGTILLGGLLITGYRKTTRALLVEPHLHGLTLAYFLVAIIYNFTEAGFRMMTPVWFAYIVGTMNASMPAPKYEAADALADASYSRAC